MSLAAPYQEHYYVADGSTTSFAFGQSFTALNEIDVKCIIYFEDGTNCVPVFNVNMTTGFINIVSLTKPDGTLLTVPPAGSIVRVFRKTPEAQNVTASQLQNYTAKQLERVFDSLVAMIQEISYSDIHKTVRLTETQRDIAIDYLPDDKDQAVIYWDVEERKLMPAGFGQNQVVKSDGVEWLVYNQSEGKVYFIPRQGGNPIPIGKATIHNDLSGRNAPDCHPESAITGLREHLQELRDKDLALDEDVQTALNRSQEAKDTADEAKGTAEYAQNIAGQAKDIAEDAKETAEGIEDIAEEAKDIALESNDRFNNGDIINQIPQNGLAFPVFRRDGDYMLFVGWGDTSLSLEGGIYNVDEIVLSHRIYVDLPVFQSALRNRALLSSNDDIHQYLVPYYSTHCSMFIPKQNTIQQNIWTPLYSDQNTSSIVAYIKTNNIVSPLNPGISAGSTLDDSVLVYFPLLGQTESDAVNVCLVRHKIY